MIKDFSIKTSSNITLKKACLLGFILVLLKLNCLGQNNEYMLKAAFFEKFAHFTEWPTENSNQIFNISILGNHSFNNEFENLYQNIEIKGLPVKIHYISKLSELESCEILFIASSERKKLNEIIRVANSKQILTIADTKGFGKQGVIINFYTTIENTIHFEINTKALESSVIKMDIMLLDFAKIIN